MIIYIILYIKKRFNKRKKKKNEWNEIACFKFRESESTGAESAREL